MPEFTNFSFRNVNVVFGLLEIQGWAEGDDVCDIDFTDDQFSKVTGVKGDVVRSQSSDNSAVITLKLLQTSSSNKDLTTVYNIDRLTGLGVAPMTIEDKETGETYTINNAWIRKFPKVTRGKTANQMIWIFDTDYVTPKM